ncbi:S8 family serine peptidase [Lacisediminimonas profundi]|uniref:S8 family serine peptidase n=1 Tax=Lacisediminimonas profundi TaxID=2603856 RepID=UPI00124B52E7|nr:S8 family serine peptidase [Lacisediminimonas profundi]
MPKPDTSPGAAPDSSGSSGTRTARRATDRPETDNTGQPRRIGRRKSQFLVASRQTDGLMTMGLMPLQSNVIEQALRSNPEIEIVDIIKPKAGIGAFAAGMGDSSSVMVARMADEKASVLQQQGQGRLIVEHDQSLHLLDPSQAVPGLVSGFMTQGGVPAQVGIVVLGSNNAPVAGAEVYLFGSLLPANATTDEQGRAVLTLYGETPESITALYVKPKADYWSFYQRNPDIDFQSPNGVGLRPLAEWPSLSMFPQQQALGWGQRAMRLDRLPPQFRGQGIKIAIIDSGAATSHDDLKGLHLGIDILNKKTAPDKWSEDMIAHGSHCAGVIAGGDGPHGVRGFAPDAEIHVCKLFPGGQVSQLIDALEYCIEQQVDVVNLSLGGAQPSEALEQQLLRARRQGIACIVAAGNSGNEVQYPASSPHVLAVAAIGKLGEFPPDSYHTETVGSGIDSDGYFSAKFSCFGPQIAVCAPGVAIASSVPTNNFAVWDGTSMAAPHVTGLAALILAHHPDFKQRYAARSAERVERLFQVIRYSARPINVGNASKTGFGLPDVLIALGLQPPAANAYPAGLQGASGQIGSLARMPGATVETMSLSPFSTQFGGEAYQHPAWSGLPGMGAMDGLFGVRMPGWMLNLGAGRAPW